MVCTDRVLVAGRNYGNILALTRALGRAGYQVDILRIYKKKPGKNPMASMKPDSRSRYVGIYSECIVQDETSIVDSLMAINDTGKKMLLIPVDDYSVYVADICYDTLKDSFIIPSIEEKQGEIAKYMDKMLQKKEAEKSNLPILKSTVVRGENGTYEISPETPFPCFIKPNVSMKSTKDVMSRVNNEDELRHKLDGLGTFDILAEEYLDIANEYSILGICAGGRSYSPGVFRVTMGGHRQRRGVAITGVTCNISDFGSLVEECGRYVESIGYCGMYDIDLIEDRNGKIYFVEINFRAGASIHVFTEQGINLPGMLADYYLKGKDINTATVAIEGKTFVSEKILIEEYARNDISKSEMIELINKADVCFIKDDKDKKPYEDFKRYFKVAGALRLPYRIKDNRG